MGDIADDMLDEEMRLEIEYQELYRENLKLNDRDLIDTLSEDEHEEIISSICKYYNKNGFITKKQRGVLLNYLTQLDVSLM